jgi:hypothetical protein
MDWFANRYSTIIEALTAQRFLVVGAIFGLGAAAANFAPRISWGGRPMLLNTPPWTWGVMVALLALLYFIFEYAHRKRMELVPKIRLSFDQHAGGIVQTPTQITKVERGVLQQADSNGSYVRIKIETASKGVIRDCVAFLKVLHKKNVTSGEFARIQLPYAIPLTPQPISIYSSVPHFVDFFQVGEENVPTIPPPWPLTLRNAFQEATSYLFTIAVVAGGVTEEAQVEVNWTGAWNTLSANPRNPIYP